MTAEYNKNVIEKHKNINKSVRNENKYKDQTVIIFCLTFTFSGSINRKGVREAAGNPAVLRRFEAALMDKEKQAVKWIANIRFNDEKQLTGKGVTLWTVQTVMADYLAAKQKMMRIT